MSQTTQPWPSTVSGARGAAAGLLLCLVLVGCSAPEPDAPDGDASDEAVMSPVRMLRDDPASTAGFARAEQPRAFVFPADHGPHPDFQTEWWYFTGHLQATDGSEQHLGFQWTVFRRALTAAEVDRDSAWATRQLYMAHFAVADIDGGRFHAFERFSRGAVGLAGASATPFRVWLDDWQVASVGDPVSDTIWPVRLRAAEAGVGLDLVLDPDKPRVLQGDRGWSPKHADGASYYYSYTRLRVRGRAEVGGRSFEVVGSAWLDREWSTSVLADDQIGWDWFSIQLDDGRDLMIYQLRTDDGPDNAWSSGVLVAVDGSSRRLTAEDFSIRVLDHWRSPRTAGDYPNRWHVVVPAHGLDLRLEPKLADQELAVSFPYWEGAVAVDGSHHGSGYVELVGYAGD